MMGMFDYVRCDVPLPRGYQREGYRFQTKDYGCDLAYLRITTDGYLMAAKIDEQLEIVAAASPTT